MIELGQIAGLRITARFSAVITMVTLWVVLSVVAVSILGLPTGPGIIGALAATGAHWLGELIHQLGHSIAAKRTGYPMSGVYFWGPIATSIYPKNEPPLPGNVHIQRALGGPIMSGFVTLAAGLLYLFLSGTFTLRKVEPHLGTVIPLVGLFVFLDNLLVFTFGALLPLGFTDGSTILKWWGK